MPASIFNGDAVKILKEKLRFKSGVEVITNDSDNPKVVAKSAPQGSIYIQKSTGDIYVKQDSGSSTNWSLSPVRNGSVQNVNTGKFYTTVQDAANEVQTYETILVHSRNTNSQNIDLTGLNLTNVTFMGFGSAGAANTVVGQLTLDSTCVNLEFHNIDFFPNNLDSILDTGSSGTSFNECLADRNSGSTCVRISGAPSGAAPIFRNCRLVKAVSNNGTDFAKFTQFIDCEVFDLFNANNAATFMKRCEVVSSIQATGLGLLDINNTVTASIVSTQANLGVPSFILNNVTVRDASGTSGLINKSGNAQYRFLDVKYDIAASTVNGTDQSEHYPSNVSYHTRGKAKSALNSLTRVAGSHHYATDENRKYEDDGTILNKVTYESDLADFVTGPASATDTAVAVYDSTTGKLIKDSTVTIDNSGNTTFNGTVNLNQDATTSLQAVTKQQLDASINGIQRKLSVKVSTTANITLSGEQTIDGVLTSSSRVLVRFQTDQKENGIYLTDAGAWTRTEDANSSAELNHAIASIEAGTIYENRAFEQITDNPSIGVDNIIFTQAYGAGTYVADETSLTLNGATFSVKDDGVTTAKVLNANITNEKIATGVDAVKLADGSVTNTEFQYINSLTSNAQDQIDTKVTGPVSAIDSNIATFDTVTGKLVKDSLTSINSVKIPQSTGMVSKDVLISIGSPTSTFSISDGNSVVVDSYTDPTNTTVTEVSWTGLTNLTVTNLATSAVSFIAINSAGAVIQQTTPFTNSQMRDLVSIGSLVHIGGTVVESVSTNPNFIGAVHSQLDDIAAALGPININGNVYSSNGANLNINKSSGSTFTVGGNYTVDIKDPNVSFNAAQTALTFFQNYQDGVGGFTIVPSQTLIDPDQYDDGTGTLASMPNNQFQIKRLFFGAAGSNTIIHYGQATYSSLADAEAAIFTEVFNKNPLLSSLPLRGWLIVREGNTDLTNTAQAKFINAGKFGEGAVGGATSSTTTLQVAYNNSAEPEIILNSTRNAFNISDNATPITGDLFAVQNSGGATKFLNVDTQGIKSSNVSASTALESNANGAIISSATTSAELAHVSGVTSSIQTQLDDKIKEVFRVMSNSGTFTATVNITYIVDTSGGTAQVTLPTAAIDTFVRIKDNGNANTNNITVLTPLAETIDGAVSDVIESEYASITYVCDGVNWWRL